MGTDNKKPIIMTVWISVKDRLPEATKNVLVYMERNAWRENGKRYRKKEIGIGWQINGHWHVDGVSEVIAFYWMPLPKPPKEK